MNTVKNILNPKHPTGGYFAPHLTFACLLVLALAIGFTSGWFAGTKYTRSYYAQRYANTGLPAEHFKQVIHVAPVTVNLAAVENIDIAHYPAVGDQGQQGACGGWCSAWALSYDYRESHLLTHPGIRFSPAWEYTWYSDKYNSCQDGGSWPVQDLEMVPSIGIPQFKYYPAPQAIACPFPAFNSLPTAYDNAAHFKIPVSVSELYTGVPSDQVYTEIKVALSQGEPAMLGINVPPSFDAATQTSGLIWDHGVETSRGGHCIVALKVDDTKVFPDGEIGGVYVQNQWGTSWGINGRAWISRGWLARNGWAVLELHGAGVSAMHSSMRSLMRNGKTPTYVPNHAPKHVLSHTLTASPPPLQTFIRAWYVKNVILRDTRQNISLLLNRVGDQYNLAPYGLAAVAATESGWRAVADRCCAPGDTSYGSFQFTTGTAAGYGVCHDNASCKRYLDNPDNSAHLAGLFLSQAKLAACVDFPYLYIAYNEGAGYGCGAYTYTHPTGQAATNYYNNFLPNYNVVVSSYLSSSSGYQKKAVFPLAKWESAGRRFSPYYNHRLSSTAQAWVRVSRRCGGVTRQWEWHRKGRFTKQTFAHCSIYTWPRRGYKSKVTF